MTENMRRFVDERCLVGPGMFCGLVQLHAVCRAWCVAHGIKPPTVQALWKSLVDSGFVVGGEVEVISHLDGSPIVATPTVTGIATRGTPQRVPQQRMAFGAEA